MDTERIRLLEGLKAKLAAAGKLGDPIARSALREGEIVQTASQVGRMVYGRMSGPILKLGRKNVRMKVDYQPAPNGPVYVQEHVVPRGDLDFVLRDDLVHELVDEGGTP